MNDVLQPMILSLEPSYQQSVNHLQVGFWEFKGHITTGEFFVHGCKCINLVLNCGLLIFVQMHLDQLGTIELNANAFADNLSGEYQILKDGIIHSSQSAGAWALLFVWVGATATWLG